MQRTTRKYRVKIFAIKYKPQNHLWKYPEVVCGFGNTD